MSPRAEPDRDALLLAELDEATARMLYPDRFHGPLEVTLVYPAFEGDLAEQAATLEATAEITREARTGDSGPPTVHATFRLDRVEELHALYSFVEVHADRSQVGVLLDDKKVPMVRELWLPLLWILRS